MKRKLLSLGLVAVLLLTAGVPVSAAENAPPDDMTASADNFNATELVEIPETPTTAEPMDNFGNEDALTSEEGAAGASNEKAETNGMAFAVESEDVEENAGEMAALMGELETPVISVITNNGDFEIIPYKIDADGTPTEEQFISQVNYIKSANTEAIDLEVLPVGLPKEGSEATFVETLDAFESAKLTKKILFVWFEFQQVENAEIEPTWSGEYTNAHGQIIVNSSRQTVVTIPAAPEGEEAYVAFKAFAYVSAPPTVWWKDTDGVTFSLNFSFSKTAEEVATLIGVINKEEPFDVIEPLENEVVEPAIDVALVEMPQGVDSEEPSDNEPVKDVETSDDTQSGKDVEPSNNTKSAEGAKPPDGMEPVENVELSDDTDSLKDTEPSDVAEPVENTEQSEDTQSVANTEAPDITEVVEEAETSDNREPVKNTEPSDDTQPVENAEPSDGTEPVEDAEPSEDTQPVENTDDTQSAKDAEPSDDTQSVENAEASDGTEPVEDAEPSEDTQPVENAESFDITEAVEYAEPSDDRELVKNAEPSDDTQPMENAEPSDGTEPVEDAEPSEDMQPVENAESFDITEAVEDAEPIENAESSDDMEFVGGVELSEETKPAKDTEVSDVAEPVEDAEPSGDTAPIEDVN